MHRTLTVLALILLATPAAAQQFGGALAISADQVLVGETGNRTLPGVVYLFASEDGTWRETGRLTVSEEFGPPDGFGRALAAAGQTVLVGAPSENGDAGAMYLFRSVGAGAWTQEARFTPPSVAEGDASGTSIVVDGTRALVSAPGASDGEGVVYVYEMTDGAWRRSATLDAGDEGLTGFGSALALDGSVALVATANRRNVTGSVYAFRMTRGQWTAEGKLEGGDLGDGSGYGSSLALRDGLALVGAPNHSQRVGMVLVFGFDTEEGIWTEESRLAPFEARARTQFGSTIAFDGTTTWIGAPGDAGGPGSVYAFTRENGGWSAAEKITSGTLEPGASLGTTAAVMGDVAVLGAGGVDSRAGAAVIYERGERGWMERNTVINDVRGLPAIAGDEVACVEDRASGYECSNVNIVSFLPVKDLGGTRGTRVNDIWGWTDPQTGVEYAIVGRTDGTAFVDLSDPSHPVFVGNLPKTEGSRSAIWRDMKVYRDHVYIVADGAMAHGVQVFDLARLREVRNPPATFEPTFTYDGIHSAHNIVINEETGYAYAVGNSSGGETCGGGLHMMSLENPARPVFAGCFADATTGRRLTGYSHDAQCVIYRGPDTTYQGHEICLGSNETALSIADVTDKNNPVALAMASYPNVAYTHQGWLTEDHRYFYMNDEGDEPQGLVPGTRTLVWDVMDLDDPILVKEHIAATTTTDHNLYIRGNTMYQSNYGSGLRILDISEPENPVEIGFFDTTPYGGSGSWSNYPFFESGLIVATSTDDGLFVLKSTARPALIP